MSRGTKRTLVIIGVLLAALAAQIAYGTYVQIKRARMSSQCAILSLDIANYIQASEDAGKQPDVDDFLLHFDGGKLFDRDSEGRLLDSWGRPLKIEYIKGEKQDTVRVGSAGRDGKFGTADDFSRECTVDHKD
jgi:hypothetical protein